MSQQQEFALNQVTVSYEMHGPCHGKDCGGGPTIAVINFPNGKRLEVCSDCLQEVEAQYGSPIPSAESSVKFTH